MMDCHRDLPRLGVVLRILNLVLGHNIGILVEDKEPGRPGHTAHNSVSHARHGAPDGREANARCPTVERTDELALLEVSHGGRRGSGRKRGE